MPYEVSTPVFEGPFDLLLHLITKQQVDLYEVSLSAIVDAYLAHLATMEALDLDVATEFLLIAATLVELKSRRLLPDVSDGELDEELALWEERDLLLARLLECKTFKDAARALDRLAAGAELSRPRVAGMEERFLSLVPDVLAGVTPDHLRTACLRALAPKPPPPAVDLSHVSMIRASVRDTVDELLTTLPAAGPTTLRRLTAGIAERILVIVHFLALLELYKDGLVELDQPTTFGELRVTWVGPVAGFASQPEVARRAEGAPAGRPSQPASARPSWPAAGVAAAGGESGRRRSEPPAPELR
ncbi:MAG TPA: ScpA family protein [Acidimicrobiales bacterium]|nr:ScpA family protein [Acidimicrobiales bacterium]